MRKYLHVIIVITFAFTLQQTAVAQSLNVNTTGAVADPTAIVDVTSTAKSMLVQRIDKNHINAIATPANGLLVFQSASDSIGF